MLRLQLTNTTRWIELVPGVKIEVLPMGTSLVSRAQARLRADRTEGDTTPVPRSSFALAIAQEAVIDWTGVGDEAGRPLAVSPAGVMALMEVFPVHTAFERLYVAPGLVLAEEGNVSAPLPSGTSAGALPIAKRARAAATTASTPKKPRGR